MTEERAPYDLGPGRVDLRSLDIAAEKRAELLRLLPECATEGGKIDFERLKAALGEQVDAGKERYGLSWPGKAECMRTIQRPSLATLRPKVEESVQFDSTQNLIIEGDNLEVLKLLQKSYLGKVKMIYIDPPYNTGNDFIYPDNYTESLETYLKYTGQVDDEGNKFSTNTEADGRFHSKWLNMMYPRLYLARNLLREDGVLLVSINDRESSRLRDLLDELFGGENFVAQFVWNNEGNVDQQSKIKGVHEYIICFARDVERLARPTAIDPNIEESSKLFRDTIENTIIKNGPGNPPSTIELPAGFPASVDSLSLDPQEDAWPHRLDALEVRDGQLVKPVRLRSGWSSRNLLDLFIRNGHCPILDSEGKETRFAVTATGAVYVYKQRAAAQGHVLSVIRNVGTTQSNSAMLAKLGIVFAYPKPLLLLSYFVAVFAAEPDSLVLDFFAGSGTTAHGLIDQNLKDGGNRKFILVQLPEPTDRTDYPTIADITKERVRRVIKNLNDADRGMLRSADEPAPDRGFRVFQLATSNFKPWDGDAARDGKQLQKQLGDYLEHVLPDRSEQDLLYEILLKDGFELAVPIETLDIHGFRVFSIAGGQMLLCLQENLTLELIRALADHKPTRVVCLDRGFLGNDQLKANAVKIFASKGVEKFKTV